MSEVIAVVTVAIKIPEDIDPQSNNGYNHMLKLAADEIAGFSRSEVYEHIELEIN